jgi:hypothetical protein
MAASSIHKLHILPPKGNRAIMNRLRMVLLLLFATGYCFGQSAGSISANSCVSYNSGLIISSAADADFSGDPLDIDYDWIISYGTTTLIINTGSNPTYTWTATPTTSSFTVSRQATDHFQGLGPITTAPLTVNLNPGIIILSASPKTCTNLVSFPVTYSFAGITSVPDKYSIQWTAPAALAGFADVPSSNLNGGGGSFNVPLPATPTPGNFTGTLTLLVTSTGCSSSGPSSVDVFDPPTLSITNPTAVCSPSTVNLVSPAVRSGASTYTYWTDVGATSALAGPAAVGSGGTYYIRGTSTAATGSCLSTVDPVVVSINPLPTVNITDPTAVCAPNTINLTAAAVTAGSTGGLTFTQWTDAIASSALANPNAVTTGNTYYIKGTTAANCSVIRAVVATINPLPTVNITNPAAACAPNTVDLTAAAITAGSTAGLTFTRWTDVDASSALANPNAVATGNTYYIKGTTAANCSVVQAVIATINPLPTVNITNPVAVCSPSTVDLTAAAVTAGSTGGLTFTQWTDAIASSALANPNAVATGNTYYIKGTTAANCSAIQAVIATINPLPTVNITNPAAVCAPNTVDLTAAAITAGSTAGLTFTRWTDVGASSALANPNAVATGNTYYIKGTTAANCSAVQAVIATINPLPTVNITNPAAVCSPNTIDLTDPAITAGSTAGLVYTQWADGAATSALAKCECCCKQ